MNTIELTQTIQTNILQLVAAGIIPVTIGSFGDLHDYCDANVLGECENLYNELVTESQTASEHDAKLDAVNAIMNPAQGAVDAWIKAGGILNAVPAMLTDKSNRVIA